MPAHDLCALDHMKNISKTWMFSPVQREAHEAMELLRRSLMAEEPGLWAQCKWEVSLTSHGLLAISNDDSILQCALQVQKHNNTSDVIL
ncbi:hypothetical protein UPYG_G00348750 [Umbra pygmaea]|uniref:PIN domain-containing protein n=1 Tax=Umbra pygmaea TaxID=75934 RepID=A0ABD0VY09_UMBPY